MQITSEHFPLDASPHIKAFPGFEYLTNHKPFSLFPSVNAEAEVKDTEQVTFRAQDFPERGLMASWEE